MLYHIVDQARVEDSSQATLRRKRFHYNVTPHLGIKGTYRQTNTRLVTAAYVVDNQARRVWIRVWIVANVIHGTNA